MTKRAGMPAVFTIAFLSIAVTAGCGAGSEGAQGGGRPGGPPSRNGRPGGGAGSVQAVPVEVASAARRTISSYIETNGTLEAENEVDIVARVSGPITALSTEEGQFVEKGRLLAQLDDTELRAQLEISRVELNETELSFERAEELRRNELISTEEFERARAAYESAQAQFEGNRILLDYTQIRAPFSGLIVRRYVDFAEHVATNAPLLRISDFTPLLCPIRIPERDLARLEPGQRAYLTVESWPDERFEASVLRVSPVVDAATGTVKVTLEVDARGKLRPGMFASVFVETDSRTDSIVVPKVALSLESIGDTVYVADGEAASRREVSLGYREGDFVEVKQGVDPGELVVVVGQDGLSDGTPIRVLRKDGEAVTSASPSRGGPPRAGSGARGEAEPPGEGRQERGGGPGRGRPDFASMTPEQLERAKELMRERGMSEEQIKERIAGGRREGSR